MSGVCFLGSALNTQPDQQKLISLFMLVIVSGRGVIELNTSLIHETLQRIF